MIISSRSAAEYRAMLGLASADLAGAAALDCCAGGSSFTAETAGRVMAADPAYALDRHDLARRVRASLHQGDQMIAEHARRFDWSWYSSRASRQRLRAAAAGRFLDDIRARPRRYIAAALPRLPLASASFDLVLCSHLLFTWANRLDAGWHYRALAELARVARREVRVYPTVVQGTGHPVAFLDELRGGLHAAGYLTRLQEVPYRFQRGAHQMLVVTAGNPLDALPEDMEKVPGTGDRAGALSGLPSIPCRPPGDPPGDTSRSSARPMPNGS
jgi:SAM-dependent methyltransferase